MKPYHAFLLLLLACNRRDPVESDTGSGCPPQTQRCNPVTSEPESCYDGSAWIPWNDPYCGCEDRGDDDFIWCT